MECHFAPFTRLQFFQFSVSNRKHLCISLYFITNDFISEIYHILRKSHTGSFDRCAQWFLPHAEFQTESGRFSIHTKCPLLKGLHQSDFLLSIFFIFTDSKICAVFKIIFPSLLSLDGTILPRHF